MVPEEVRVRFGDRRRIVPQGTHKQILANWVSGEMRMADCERLIFLLCRLRKGVGLPIPKDRLDNWLKQLLRDDC